MDEDAYSNVSAMDSLTWCQYSPWTWNIMLAVTVMPHDSASNALLEIVLVSCHGASNWQ